MADEVQEIAPELVTTDSEGYKGIAYAHATVIVAQAVKELQQKHDQEITELKQEVADLRAMVTALLKAHK